MLFPLFSTCVVDTIGKFATSINNTSGTGGKIYQRYRWQNLPAVPVAKFATCVVDVIFGAWGKMIHEKKLKQKIS
jgi:hypothetical protein